jgi:hypothetical protein
MGLADLRGKGGRVRTVRSIQTTERYLGSEQDLAVAENDNLGL